MKNEKAYKQYVQQRAAKSSILKNTGGAFLVGGAISLIAEVLFHAYRALGASLSSAPTMVTVTVVLIAVLLTAFGVFGRIARFAGAGTLLPVTGFANAVVSPAIDTAKSEGPVLGVGSKIFTVAGPVILYAILSGAIYGVIYWIVGVFTA